MEKTGVQKSHETFPLNVAMCREKFRITSTRRTISSSSGLPAMIAASQKSSTRSEQ
jgi:hypothetical protein